MGGGAHARLRARSTFSSGSIPQGMKESPSWLGSRNLEAHKGTCNLHAKKALQAPFAKVQDPVFDGFLLVLWLVTCPLSRGTPV